MGARLRLILREAGVAFFLGSCAWLLLCAVWMRVSPDGWGGLTIRALMYPPYGFGRHLARDVFHSYESWSSVGYYAAPSMGIAAEVLFLTGLWFIALELGRCFRTDRRSF